MATYTMTVNERTKTGKGLIGYLRNLGVIEEPNKTTLAAMKELEEGGGTYCDSFEDYLKAVESIA